MTTIKELQPQDHQQLTETGIMNYKFVLPFEKDCNVALMRILSHSLLLQRVCELGRCGTRL